MLNPDLGRELSCVSQSQENLHIGETINSPP